MKELLKSNEYQYVLNYFNTMNFADKKVYANWLAQTYYFVSHSVRLSALGASKLDVDCPIGKRMQAHTMEEKGHHVLAEKDIQKLGYQLKDFPAFGVTNAFYQSQYYKVLFEHPYHLLGQIFMLEAFSVDAGPQMWATVKQSHGELACHFVRVHANEDIDHVKKALEAIESFPAEQKKGVTENFKQACELYYMILRSVNESAFQQIIVDAA